MRSSRVRFERGMALLALLAVIALGSSWYLVSQMNAESGSRSAIQRTRNAEVLNRAKRALIGYVAQRAATAGESNPGRLPCPEAVNNIGTSDEGGSAPWVGPPATANCSSIGRLPWRTLGLDKLVDSANEPLWYVVGPTWRLSNSSSTLLINSNTVGDIVVDGKQVVALIIAPGAAISAQAATGCTARNQSRSVPAPTMDARDYIECFDSGTLQFVTTAASTSSNDQIVRITVDDVMPAIEAAIANRIEREIVPALNTVYTPTSWGFSVGNPVYPYPATFASPGPGAGTSNYQGAAGIYRGLLPFNQTQNCTPSAADPRCTTTMLAFSKYSANDTKTSGSGYIQMHSNCSWSGATYVCTGEYFKPSIAVTVRLRVTNVAMGLRSFDPSKISFTAMNDTVGGWGTQTIPFTAATVLNTDGSATLTIAGGTLPDIDDAGWGTYANYRVSVDRAAFGDHALLSSTDATTGWFVRNEWYRLVYYATAQTFTAAQLPTAPACANGTTCLTVSNLSPSNNKRALLVLAGRSLNGVARPSATLSDYFEFGNAAASYERQTITPVPAGLYTDTGSSNAYAIAVSSLATGATLQFRAANANTGSSTLNTGPTGTRPLVDTDGNPLASGAIRANAAVQVIYDGSRFKLTKRPFNDRIIVIGSN